MGVHTFPKGIYAKVNVPNSARIRTRLIDFSFRASIHYARSISTIQDIRANFQNYSRFYSQRTILVSHYYRVLRSIFTECSIIVALCQTERNQPLLGDSKCKLTKVQFHWAALSGCTFPITLKRSGHSFPVPGASPLPTSGGVSLDVRVV